MTRARVAATLLAAALMAARPPAAVAQAPGGTAPAAASASPTLQVFLITMGEGEYYWEKFGHNALWFRDPAQGIDVAYNWGMFDFNEPGFLGRILTGDTRYWVDGIPAQPLLDFYRQSDRSIVVQRLGFTPEQASRALQYSRWNALDENKYYQYDYFRDNCSTRVRDVIDLALGGALRVATANAPTAQTYRLESLRLVDDMKLVQFGINAALARPSDVPISVWQDMFVPARMQAALRGVRVPSAAGDSVPLVAEERVLYESRGHRERPDAPTLWIPYLIAGLLIGAELFTVGFMGVRSGAMDKVFRIEAALWAFITGLLGLVLLLAWLITQHAFWYRNDNLLLLNPLSLFLAGLAVMSLRGGRWARPATICAVIVAMGASVALMLKGLPGLTQNNLSMILLLLPPHFAVAYGFWRRTRADA